MSTLSLLSPDLDASERRRRQDALAIEYRRDPDSRNRVVTELLPIVHAIAKRYNHGEEPLDDLVQVGSVGLLKALAGFDPEYGRSFFGYAYPTITGEIRRHFRDTGWAVHVPRAVQERAHRVKAAERALRAETGRAPTIAALVAAVGETHEAVTEAWLAGKGMRAGSLDRRRGDDDEAGGPYDRHLRVIDDGFLAVETRSTIGALTRGLPEREREIIVLRYGQGLTQRQIGDRLGTSQMQISRLLRRINDELQRVALTG